MITSCGNRYPAKLDRGTGKVGNGDASVQPVGVHPRPTQQCPPDATQQRQQRTRPIETRPGAEGGTASGTTCRYVVWVIEASGLMNLTGWPPGMRVIVRRERPHPGAQLRTTDRDGLRGDRADATATSPTVVSSEMGRHVSPAGEALGMSVCSMSISSLRTWPATVWSVVTIRRISRTRSTGTSCLVITTRSS
jgi:hypothetical protein